jgi:hypothetical protein
MIVCLAILLFVKMVTPLIGFDCSGQHLNITVISFLDVEECELHIPKTNTTNVYIQLLQLSEYNYAKVLQCKIEIWRTIYHCGMYSHISVVHNGQANYLHETGYTQCRRLFQDGEFSLGTNNLINGIQVNQTTTRSVTLAGRINNDGREFSIPIRTVFGMTLSSKE